MYVEVFILALESVSQGEKQQEMISPRSDDDQKHERRREYGKVGNEGK